MDIFHPGLSRWDYIVGQWRQGKKIDKAEIVQLLGTDDPIPPKANALLAGLITGAIKARHGRKSSGLSPMWRGMVARDAASLETQLEDPSKIPEDTDKAARDRINAIRLERGAGSAQERANREVAQWYGVTERMVRTCREEKSKKMEAIAKEHGVTVDAVKRALRFGEP